MSGCSTEVQDLNQQKTTRTEEHDSMTLEANEEDNQKGDGNGDQNMKEDHAEDDDDDDEDVDFNPFLKDYNSLEASSSLSSEVEDLEADVADSGRKPSASSGKSSMEKDEDISKDSHRSENVRHGDEIVSQSAVSCEEVSASDPQITHTASSDTDLALIDRPENGLLYDKDSIMGADTATELQRIEDVNSEGAICMRTRARYSLASFTLDELETFLQETDDEDDIQNVDDEAEYRKFLAAVLRGDDSQNLQENVNADDEDEDNDADFELELEEALESEVDEIEERHTRRRNRRQRTSAERSSKLSVPSSRPLRPLLPFASLGSSSALDGKFFSPNSAHPYMINANNSSTCGFTPHQIGQLHCLIHEHVQLLVQVFSVCVIDHSKNHITMEVKKLISEMLQKREEVLARKTLPYPSPCFFPPYVQPSVPDDLPKTLTPNGSNRNVQRGAPSQNIFSWVPYVYGPVLSVMDVAPLRLIGNYIDEVSSAVKAHERYRIEHGFDTPCQNEPLFALHISACSTESDGHVNGENGPPNSIDVVSSSSTNQTPKKTMAATLLEKAKSQPVVVVPKEIADLAQRFWPLFNPTLYPHQPPPAPLANRVLFTDTEDELLALGLMEYNTDWKAIQQRFLPCKSRHQIFVRQKNRAASKAPENPIKAVRRMKNSPLTTEEIARIEMGLKKFKLDWISIWRFFVPYRDPSLLPRQWRIACGTQKSYKLDATKKTKRRLYEFRRKSLKQLSSTRHSSSEKEGDSSDNPIEETNYGENNMDKEDEAYVHEAFLADWIPGNNASSHTHLFSQEGYQSRVQTDYSGSGGIQSPWVSKTPSQRLSSSEIVLRPYRARRSNTSRLVKLAPGLPPVNLPPSVRVISRAAFRNSQEEATTGNVSRVCNVAGKSGYLNARSTPNVGIHYSIKSGESRSNSKRIIDANMQQNQSLVSNEKCVTDRGDLDLQMHPLLFQSPRDGHLPYYPLTCDTSTSSSFSLYSRKQPHLSLSLFHNPRHIKDAMNFLSNSSKVPDKDASSSADFHPLLRRADEVDDPHSSRNDPPIDNSANISHQNGKINELDLDMHLNFVSKNQGVLTSTSMAPTTPSNGTMETENGNKKRTSASDAINNIKLDSSDYAMVARGIKQRGQISDVHDESLPHIIMEQEELSDSDEELGENVEFEREEMADSEGDSASDSEQFVNAANEVPNAQSNREGNAHVAVNNTNARPLNLNFCPVSPHPTTSNVMAGQNFGPFGTAVTSNSKESTKPGNSRIHKRIKEDASDYLNMGSSETLPAAKARKRSCK